MKKPPLFFNLKKYNENLKKYNEKQQIMKKLPFDLEKAKAGAKLVTRNGNPVRIVCWDYKREMGSRERKRVLHYHVGSII